jgi:hypothetical protein
VRRIKVKRSDRPSMSIGGCRVLLFMRRVNSTLADAEVFPWIVRLSLARGPNRGPAGQAGLWRSPDVFLLDLSLGAWPSRQPCTRSGLG